MSIKKMIVVGAGGIGSHFIPSAARVLRYTEALDGDFIIIDGDKYEEKNAQRQLFEVRHLGQNKAVVQASMAFSVLPAAIPMDTYIESADAFAGIAVLGTGDWGKEDYLMVCLCVDNDATRRLIYDALKDTALNFVVIDMANELHTGDVIVAARWDGSMPLPWPPDVYPNIQTPADRTPGAYCTQAAPDSPQIITANMMAACIGVEILRRFATNSPSLENKVAFSLTEFKMYGMKG